MSSGAPTTKTGNTFASFKLRQFRWLIAGNFAFFLAMQGQILTRSFLAWRFTADEMALAYVNIAFALPMILFSIIGGALVDRYERRTVAQWSQLLLLFNEATILLLLVTDSLAFWHLLAAGVVGGTVIPTMMSARTALIFNVVGNALLTNATALSVGVMNITRVLGPMLMGLALAHYSATIAYLIATTLFFVAFFCLFGISKKPMEIGQRLNLAVLTQETRDGLVYIYQSPHIRSCLLFGFLILTLAIPLQSLLILFTDNVWEVNETGLGILMSVAGCGGVIGSFWVATRSENKRRFRPMVNGAIICLSCFAVFSLSPAFYFALLPLALGNIFASSTQILNNTTIQLLTDDRQRGRVSSFMMMTYGITPLGIVPLAWLAKYIGIEWSVFCGCIILLVAVILFSFRSDVLRSLDDAVKVRLQNTKKPLVQANKH